MVETDQMSRRLSMALNVVSAGCAVFITVLVARRYLIDRPRVPTLSPTPVANWSAYSGGGHRIGPDSAPVTIVEFGDFECPVCGQFARSSLRAIRTKFPRDVAVVYRYWPLSYHHLARPAARAAECASLQGRFQQFHDALYAEQDSLGLKSWSDFAVESGIVDTVRFDACLRSAAPDTVIQRDENAAVAIGGHGTPTIVVNGKRLGGAPDSAAFDRLVSELVQKAKRSK